MRDARPVPWRRVSHAFSIEFYPLDFDAKQQQFKIMVDEFHSAPCKSLFRISLARNHLSSPACWTHAKPCRTATTPKSYQLNYRDDQLNYGRYWRDKMHREYKSKEI